VTAPVPLSGRRVLVARARPGRSDLGIRLRDLGAEVIEIPEIDVEPAAEALEVAGSGAHDAVVFACATGTDAVLGRRALDLPLIAVGRHARAALARHGAPAAVMVEGACRDALEAHRAAFAGRRLLLVTSDQGRPGFAGPFADALRSVPMVAMGPRTEASARRLGAARVARAATDTLPALVASTLANLEAPWTR